jgi:protein-S-isoprenylcysteine O-methyltransferase Ste14
LDAALCLAFCVLHSVLVRRGFRERIERFLPPHLYPAAFSAVSGVALLALVVLWQDTAVVIVEVDGAAEWVLRGVFLAAVPGFLWSARSIPSFDPLGVEPIRARLGGGTAESRPFAVRGPYRWVRHPQYSFTLILLWAYPDLTADRLLLDLVFSAWIVLGSVLEERDLVDEFGEPYREYRRNVPMLVPYRRPWNPA